RSRQADSRDHSECEATRFEPRQNRVLGPRKSARKSAEFAPNLFRRLRYALAFETTKYEWHAKRLGKVRHFLMHRRQSTIPCGIRDYSAIPFRSRIGSLPSRAPVHAPASIRTDLVGHAVQPGRKFAGLANSWCILQQHEKRRLESVFGVSFGLRQVPA